MPNNSYGLIGHPLTHSFSKQYFTQKFESEKIDAAYLNFETKHIADIHTIIQNNPTLSGLNVTIPYKESVIPFLDELSPAAQMIGAVNTIKILREGNNVKLIGHNTDAYGFHRCIKPFFKGRHERALILGTGGASKAVVHVLENLGVDCLHVSRSPKEAFSIGYNQLNNYVMEHHLLIVNTTPVGTFPNTEAAPNIPYELLSDQHLLVDLVYNPTTTKFMEKGLKMGSSCVNGLTMLHQQAEKAWFIWNAKD